MPVNRRITLAARPVGLPQESDFALDEVEIGSPQPGEALVRTLWASVDPYQRGRMSEARSYAKSLEVGDVITSVNLGEVVESKDPRFSPGDLVVGQLGWQEYATARAGTLRQVPAVLEPPTLALHAIGLTGFTAYFGLFDIGKPRPGDTVVVCGQVSQYNAERPEPTFHPGLLVVFRARMEGFLVFDYAHRYDEAAARLLQWVANGDIHWREDVTEGLENTPRAFIGMLNGE